MRTPAALRFIGSGAEDAAIWNAINLPRQIALNDPAIKRIEVLKGTDTITDVGDGEIVSVDESRTDGARKIERAPDGYLTATYLTFPNFPPFITRASATNTRSHSPLTTVQIRNGPHRCSTY